MADYTAGTYRLAAGFIARSSFTNTYNLASFPRQSDQPRALKWFIPHGNSNVYDDVAEAVESLNAHVRGYGQAEFTWELGVLTPGMWDYIVTTIFANAYSANVTVMTWDRGYGWRSVYAIARRDKPSAAGDPGGFKGYKTMKITFVVDSEASDFNDEFNPLEFL